MADETDPPCDDDELVEQTDIAIDQNRDLNEEEADDEYQRVATLSDDALADVDAWLAQEGEPGYG